jgi:hypothetical protein
LAKAEARNRKDRSSSSHTHIATAFMEMLERQNIKAIQPANKSGGQTKKPPAAGGFDGCEKLSGLCGRRLFLRLRRRSLALDIFFPTFPFDRFVVLLAHSSLHSPGISIWCAIL